MNLTRAPEGNPVADGDLAGPGAEAWLTLGVRIESLTAELEENNRRYRKLWANMHRVQITAPQIPAGSLDVVSRPDLLGPRRGWYWDVRRLTAYAVINQVPAQVDDLVLWKNQPVVTNVVDVWPGEGFTHLFGKAQLLLGPDEFLVFGVQSPDPPDTAITFMGEAIQISEDCLPLYIM